MEGAPGVYAGHGVVMGSSLGDDGKVEVLTSGAPPALGALEVKHHGRGNAGRAGTRGRGTSIKPNSSLSTLRPATLQLADAGGGA
jgi:hypothetical protein